MSNYFGNSSGFGGGGYRGDVPPPRNTEDSFRGETPFAGGAGFGADQDRRDEDYPRRESSFRPERAPSPDQGDSGCRYSYEDPRSIEEIIRDFIAQGWTQEGLIREYTARGFSEDRVRRAVNREFEAEAVRQRSGSTAQQSQSSDDRYGGRDPARVDQLRQGVLEMLRRQGWPEVAARARVEIELEAEFGGSQISNEEIEGYRQYLLRVCLGSGADPRVARIAVEEQIEAELAELGRRVRARARAGGSQARDFNSPRDNQYSRSSREYSSRSRSPPRYSSSDSFPGTRYRRDRDNYRDEDRYGSRSHRRPRDYDGFNF